MLLSLDGTPLYSVGPVKQKMAIFWLTAFGSIKAIEECFAGVRVRYNTFASKLLFYAEPLSVEDKENHKVLKQCAECQKFLESYNRAAEDCSAKNVYRLFANQYLDASVWSLAEGHTRMPQLYYTRRFASPAVVLPKPLAVTLDPKPGSEVDTLAVATSTSESGQSIAKRKRKASELDELPLSELAVVEQTKRFKLE
ncbi:uncharacterized protein EAF01_007690 [Botrytis porri]|uniref:uncharacterized protein n=1 Tax=Botrytis porri TaxID=87229 RepID=UPI00190020F5|nr:uncharacterized protein EAF01_007690 [Botrytis porri]KAF7900388.1 hypothetical protein EAF01_007690 [Botrytis porri]